MAKTSSKDDTLLGSDREDGEPVPKEDNPQSKEDDRIEAAIDYFLLQQTKKFDEANRVDLEGLMDWLAGPPS